MKRLRFLKKQIGARGEVPHGEFLELCALSTSGTLTDSEQRLLDSHLSTCRDCRTAMQEFDAVVSEVIPAIASDCIGDEQPAWSGSWSEDQALHSLMKRLQQDDHSTQLNRNYKLFPSAGELWLASSDTWRNIWTLYAAGILLFIALSISLYRVGIHTGQRVANSGSPSLSTPGMQTTDGRLKEGEVDSHASLAKIEEQDRTIAKLRRDLLHGSAALDQHRLEQRRLETDLRNEEADKQSLSQERSELAEKFNAAQSELKSLQERLALAEKAATQETATVSELQDRIHELTGSLDARNEAMKDEEELLAHDRDIRELMGARDLYIAEVYDIDGNGKTKKPFGRVFYTKGKSLVFYAYDLDQQTTIKNANTFQAWGSRGPDRQQAVSLGIFYEDNASKERWVLKTSDASLLDRIDQVFVTVEPNGGSHKPSTKILLFASLKVGANHP